VSVTLSGIDSDVVKAGSVITLKDADNKTASHTLSDADLAYITAHNGSLVLGSAAFSGFAALDHADAASVTDDAGNTKPVTGNDFVLDTTADADNNLALSAFTHTGGVTRSALSITLSGIDSDFASGTVTLDDGNGHTATQP
jgi:hypothetical protein